jgi:hypothetical protein
VKTEVVKKVEDVVKKKKKIEDDEESKALEKLERLIEELERKIGAGI